jgi:5-methylcytosine-specific restriction endonuclease McrA
MRWFEHRTDAGNNKKIRKIEVFYKDRGGQAVMAAVGRFWRLLEIIGQQGVADDGLDSFALPEDYGLEVLADDLYCTVEELREFLDLLAQVNSIDPTAWEEQKVFCPKLADRAAEYTKRRISGTITNHGKAWPEIVKEVRERDRVCQKCGKTPEENGRALDIHHIKPAREFEGDHEKAHNRENLEALCLSCHNRQRKLDTRVSRQTHESITTDTREYPSSQTQSQSQVKETTPPTPPPGGNGCDPDFLVWWEEAPPPMRIGKEVAARDWGRLKRRGKLRPLAEMLAVLRRQVESEAWQREEGRFIPLASAYLRKFRFQDESAAAREPPPEPCFKCSGSGFRRALKGEIEDGQEGTVRCECKADQEERGP